jgi:hypothetical protein
MLGMKNNNGARGESRTNWHRYPFLCNGNQSENPRSRERICRPLKRIYLANSSDGEVLPTAPISGAMLGLFQLLSL